jgi:transposase-like protein
MDTSQQVAIIPRNKEGSGVPQRQRRSIADKRRIVEETLLPGASVARVARAHGINANQVFGWRRLYLAGRLGGQKAGIKLLPVRVSDRESAPVGVEHRSGDVPVAFLSAHFAFDRCKAAMARLLVWLAPQHSTGPDLVVRRD